MKHGSLFSGGGGFDLAAEYIGWQNVFHCERDKFCQTILQHYWPDTALFTDIKEFDAKPYQGMIDIITGGFPCQPFSSAGKRRGTGDDRYLWPDMLRIIKQVRPRWFVGENVFGLVNWNGGMVLQQVQSDLEDEGYQVWPYVLPASGLNAPHQRYRVYIVAFHPDHAATGNKEDHPDPNGHGRVGTGSGRKTAQRRERRKHQQTGSLCEAELEKTDPDTNGDGCHQCHSKDEKQPDQAGQYAQCHPEPLGKHVAHADGKGLEGWPPSRHLAKDWKKTLKQFTRLYKRQRWTDWPTQSPLCGGDDGLPAQLDGITFSKWRTQSIKMYGNAVVPQIVLQIFEAIDRYEQQYATNDQAIIKNGSSAFAPNQQP